MDTENPLSIKEREELENSTYKDVPLDELKAMLAEVNVKFIGVCDDLAKRRFLNESRPLERAIDLLVRFNEYGVDDGEETWSELQMIKSRMDRDPSELVSHEEMLKRFEDPDEEEPV